MKDFNKYVGLPYLLGGRDEKGIDCWGLVRLVYKEQFNIELPSLIELYNSTNEKELFPVLAEEIARRKEKWEEVTSPSVGDVILLRSGGANVHVGIYVGEGNFLHAFSGTDAVIEKITSVHWKNRIVGYYKYTENTTFDVEDNTKCIFSEGIANPFRNTYVDRTYPEGTSLKEIIKDSAVKSGCPEDFEIQGLAWVNGRLIPVELWDTTYPKSNEQVEFRVIAAGGGGFLKTVAAIMVTFGAPYAAVALGPSLGIATGAVGALTTAGSVLSAGISILGNLLLGAIFPVRPPQQQTAPSLASGKGYYALSAGSNQANQYGAIPVVLGKYRFSAPLAATPWVQTINNEKYLRMAVLWGYGPLAVSDFRIGSNALKNYDDVEIETLNGKVGEDRSDFNTLYGNDVSQLTVGVNPDGDGTPVERTLEEAANRIEVNLTAQGGLFKISKKSGNYLSKSVKFRVRYKRQGSSTWYDFGPNVLGRGFKLPTSPIYSTIPGLDFDPALNVAYKSYTWFNIFTINGDIKVVDGGAHRTKVPYVTEQLVLSNDTPTSIYSNVTIDPVPKWPAGCTKLYQICILNNPGNTTVGDEVIKVDKIIDLRSGGVTGFNLTINATADAATITDGHAPDITDEITLTGNKPDPIDKVLSRRVPKGIYTVEVVRLTPDATTSDEYDKVTLTSITGFSNNKPISPRVPMAMTSLKIKSSNQLNGNLEGLSALVQSICLDYVNSTIGWRLQCTSNPASLYRYVLQHPANPRPKTDDEIDLVKLAEWHQYCKTNGFEYNSVIVQQRSVDDILRDIAAAGRASPARPNGLYSVVIDKPISVISHHFTPHNSWGFSGAKRFPRLPHALRITFPNEEKDFQPDERFVYNDGYTISNATEIESIELPGITNTNLVHKHGRFHIAQATLRPEEYTLNCDIEHIVCTRGDRVKVTHDVPMWGLGSGRIKSLVLSGNDVVGVVLDEALAMQSGVNYSLRYRRSATGFSYIASISPVLTTGYYDTITFDTPISSNKPSVNDLVMFGELNAESVDCIVQSIEPSGNETARITLVDYAAALAVIDEEPIPEWESNISLPPAIRTKQITQYPTNITVTSDETAMVRLSNSSYTNGMLIKWSNPTGLVSAVDAVEVQYGVGASDNGVWYRQTTKPDTKSITISPVVVGDNYDIRIRYISDNGAVGKWVYSNHIITGKLLPPDDIEDFAINVVSDTATLTWTANNSLNLSHYRIRFSPAISGVTWKSSSDLISKVSKANNSVIVPAMVGTYLIKAVDDDGRESANPSLIVTNAAGLTKLNLVHSIEESLLWAGSKVNTWESFNGLRLDSSDTISDWSALSSILSLGYGVNGITPATGYCQFAEEFGLGARYSSRVTAELEVTGENVSNVLSSWVALSDVTAISGEVQGEFDAWLEISTAQDDDPSGSPTWSSWNKFVVGDYMARAFRFRVALTSSDVNVTPVVSKAKVIIDMPDRVISLTNISCSASGLTVTYPRGFRVRPAIAISAENMNTGDYYSITSANESGFFIRFFNAAGTGVARTFDYLVKGYGENTA